MVNSRAKGAVKLDTHIATGTESSYTFTPTSDLFPLYQEIHFTIIGEATAAFILHLKVDAATSYNTQTILADSTVLSATYDAADGLCNLIPATLIDAAARVFQSQGTIIKNDTHTIVQATGSAQGEGQAIIASTVTSLQQWNSLVFSTSTSTWKAGTKIIIWGIK